MPRGASREKEAARLPAAGPTKRSLQSSPASRAEKSRRYASSACRGSPVGWRSRSGAFTRGWRSRIRASSAPEYPVAPTIAVCSLAHRHKSVPDCKLLLVFTKVAGYEYLCIVAEYLFICRCTWPSKQSKKIDRRTLFFKFTCLSSVAVCMETELGRLEPHAHGILDT